MKKVAFFDIDKTIYNTHSFFQLAEYEIGKGRVKQETWDKIQKLLVRYKSGELTYSVTANMLLEDFAGDLKGQKYTDLIEDVGEFFLNNLKNFYPYFEEILSKLKETHDIYIITTNAQYVAKTIVDHFGLTGFISSEFEVIDGLFTGKVLKSLANGKSMVSDILAKYGKGGSIAVGDSENDIGMLELVEYPVCISPSEELKKYASSNNWVMTEPDQATKIFNNILDSIK
jgi:HAD superfamily phosphoserine phosphatase-like hydrolase